LSDAPAASARLAYEPLDVAHLPCLAAWADSELYRFIGDAPTLADVAARVRRITTRPPPPGELWRNWVARRRGDDACVGVVEATVLLVAEPGPPAASRAPALSIRDGAVACLAYFVFAPFQRQGYGREACAAAIAHLRSHCGVRTVTATVDTRNEASQRLVESLGFTRDEGRVAADPIGGVPAWDFRYRLALLD
jgi:ribosomal-protein-alanine N-acetyltransferase